jgi:hypothetical protein
MGLAPERQLVAKLNYFFINFVLGHRKYSAPKLPHRRKALGVARNSSFSRKQLLK